MAATRSATDDALRPPSLPSFAQSFRDTAARAEQSTEATSSSLPSIQTLPSSRDAERQRVNSGNVRKRARQSDVPMDEGLAGNEKPRSSLQVRVKEEMDELETSPPPIRPRLVVQDGGGASSPSSTHPPMPKKRRMTINGSARGNVDVGTSGRASPAEGSTGSTPISPVVMGMPINPDDREQMEHVRSMLGVKQRQQAIIEQRRGSLPGHGPNLSQLVRPPPALPDPAFSRPLPRISTGGPSPKPGPASAQLIPNSSRRTFPGATPGPAPPTLTVRVPSPPPMSGPASALPNILPTPPSSFAGRREGLGSGRRKPADLLLPGSASSTGSMASHRDEFRPVIQSAPPRPGVDPGRFPTIPPLSTLPPTLGVQPTVRRVAAQVPPTPSRLALRAPPHTAVPSFGGGGGGNSFVSIASSLQVPPTPSVLRPGAPRGGGSPTNSVERQAFMAPFESFYESLADARELKQWLGEQVQRAQALSTTLHQQQERLDEMIDAAVHRQTSGLRNEVVRLRDQVADLEAQVRAARLGTEFAPKAYADQSPSVNAVEGYTFPPADRPPLPNRGASDGARRPSVTRRISSPGQAANREYDSRTGSPAPYDSRRLNTSATRYDPPRAPPMGEPHGLTSGRHLPPLAPARERERDRGSTRVSPRSGYAVPHERPSLHHARSTSSASHGPERDAPTPPPPLAHRSDSRDSPLSRDT